MIVHRNRACKNCTKRYPLCWSTCKDYKEDQQEFEEAKNNKGDEVNKLKPIHKPYVVRRGGKGGK